MDGPCRDCGSHYIAWLTDNVIWNHVMGGAGATDDPGGLVCPNCFVERAEAFYQDRAPVSWRFVPTWYPR